MHGGYQSLTSPDILIRDIFAQQKVFFRSNVFKAWDIFFAIHKGISPDFS